MGKCHVTSDTDFRSSDTTSLFFELLASMRHLLQVS